MDEMQYNPERGSTDHWPTPTGCQVMPRCGDCCIESRGNRQEIHQMQLMLQAREIHYIYPSPPRSPHLSVLPLLSLHERGTFPGQTPPGVARPLSAAIGSLARLHGRQGLTKEGKDPRYGMTSHGGTRYCERKEYGVRGRDGATPYSYSGVSLSFFFGHW